MKFEKLIFNTTKIAFLAVLFLNFSIVILRYFFGTGAVWMQELVLYFHAALFLLGVVPTLKRDRHVRVDIFYEGLKNKSIVNKLGFFFLTLPIGLTLFYVSFPYARQSWKWVEKSADAGGLPFLYLFKSLILVFVVSLVASAFYYHVLKKDPK